MRIDQFDVAGLSDDHLRRQIRIWRYQAADPATFPGVARFVEAAADAMVSVLEERRRTMLELGSDLLNAGDNVGAIVEEGTFEDLIEEAREQLRRPPAGEDG